MPVAVQYSSFTGTHHTKPKPSEQPLKCMHTGPGAACRLQRHCWTSDPFSYTLNAFPLCCQTSCSSENSPGRHLSTL